MRKHYSNLSPGYQERLALLMEECSEVIQACSKILRHGTEEGNPYVPGSNNVEDLQKEIGHVWLAIEMLTTNGEINQEQVIGSMYKKVHSIDKYLHHQPLGVLKELRNRFTVGESPVPEAEGGTA